MPWQGHKLSLALAVVVGASVILMQNTAESEVVGVFDFEDPQEAFDWTSSANLLVEEGDLAVNTLNRAVVTASKNELTLGDVSIRTRMRLISGGSVGVALRRGDQPVGTGLFALLSDTGRAEIGVSGNPFVIVGNRNLDVDVADEDVMMQMDAIGDKISLWVWHPSDGMPTEPAIQVTNDSAQNPGEIGVGGISREWPNRGELEFIFRYVQVADSHIPLVFGDFDGDGQLTIADLDQLGVAVAATGADVRFDLTHDEIIDSDDLTEWVKDLRNTYFGDADLDGEFNSGDLVAVFEAGKFERDLTASWSEGDWDGDGYFGTGDLVAAFQDGGYELGPLNAVPEPVSAVLVMGGLIGIFCRRRKGQ